MSLNAPLSGFPSQAMAYAMPLNQASLTTQPLQRASTTPVAASQGMSPDILMKTLVQALVTMMMQFIQKMMMSSMASGQLAEASETSHGGGGGKGKVAPGGKNPPPSVVPQRQGPPLTNREYQNEGIETTDDLDGQILPNTQSPYREGNLTSVTVRRGREVLAEGGGDHHLHFSLKNADGSPIRNARVNLTNNNGTGPSEDHFTDENGSFNKPMYKNDRFKLSYRAPNDDKETVVYNITSKGGDGSGAKGEKAAHTPMKVEIKLKNQTTMAKSSEKPKPSKDSSKMA